MSKPGVPKSSRTTASSEKHQPAPPKVRKLTAMLPTELMERAYAACFWDRLTLTALVGEALASEIKPPREGSRRAVPLPGGQPKRGGPIRRFRALDRGA